MSENNTYEYFTFQFKTIDAENINNEMTSLSDSEILEKKNFFLNQILKNENNLKFSNSSNRKLDLKFYHNDDEIIIFNIANKRTTKREVNFVKETLSSSPSLTVIIDNRKKHQYILIQVDKNAFDHTTTVANILKKGLNVLLYHYKLEVIVYPITVKGKFWDIMSEFEGKVNLLKFEIERPNLARISGGDIHKDMMDMTKDTNGAKSTLEIIAPTGQHLNIDKNNSKINALVTASENGGMPEPKFRIKTEKKLRQIEGTILAKVYNYGVEKISKFVAEIKKINEEETDRNI